MNSLIRPALYDAWHDIANLSRLDDADTASGGLGAPIAGLPEVDARGQGGLLDVALSPAFETDRTIYWSFTEPRQGGNATSVATKVAVNSHGRFSTPPAMPTRSA